VWYGLDEDDRDVNLLCQGLGEGIIRRIPKSAQCGRILHITDSENRLGELIRKNLFLVPLDPGGGHFRYHHLFCQRFVSAP